MKKILLFFLIMIITVPAAFASEDISVYVNGKKLTFDQEPIIQNDYTLVPFRTIFEELQMTVQWFEDERRVTAQKDGAAVTLFIDNPVMLVNDGSVELAAPPIIYNDRTLVPLRAVSEAAGADVGWDPSTRTVTITADTDDFESWGKQVLKLVNKERRSAGLSSLQWDDSLAEVAKAHCKDMINRNFFAHDNPDNETPFDRMKQAGISYWTAGENIAAGQWSPETALKEWMESESHKKNILNADFTHMGVSVARGGTYGIYWVQEFARFR